MRPVLPCLALFACLAQAAFGLTSYWEDAAQKEVFVVEGDGYALRIATHPARILELKTAGRQALGPEGATPWIESAGRRLRPAARDFVPRWEVHTGQKMKPATSSAARMNIWRATPDYWEVHLRDIPFMGDGADELPVRGHLVIHAHPDRAHLQLQVEAGPGQTVESVGWTVDADDGTVTESQGRAIAQLGDRVALLAPPGGAFGSAAKEWSAAAGAAYWVVRPGAATFREELDPPDTAAFSARNGAWSGYDPVRGLYVLDLHANRPAFTFENAWKVPSRRMESAVSVPDTAEARRITVMARTGTGNLEAGVVTDPHGFPRAIRAFVAKNFAGEKEETDDTAFGDIVFPLSLGPGEPREHRVMGLYQNWGRLMLKQVSSIRFFNIYWHLSAGLSETTCFTHAWMDIRGALVSIPDFRPYSGPFLMGQPQHDCFSWPGFLNYDTKDGRVRPMYRRTDFHSVAPCLAHFTMHFRTSDDTADLSVEAWEIPQTDEARTFLRIRYAWDKPARVEGDARKNFRWLQMFEKYPVRDLVWLGADGKEQSTKANGAADFPLARPLAEKWPYAGAHEGRDHFGSLMLVQRLEGRLGGKEIKRAHLTADFNKENGLYALVSETAELALQPGDFLEADILLMPHAEVTTPFHKPDREREHWAVRPPVVSSVTRGEKLRDFPAAIRAEKDAAMFKVTGGLNMLPLVVGGFSARAVPMLWRDGLWQDQQAHGGDGYQVDAEDVGTFRFTFNHPIRGTEEHDLAVTLLHSDAPLILLRDDNGLPVATAENESDFALDTPVLFGPGTNNVPAQGLIAFRGRSREVRALPIVFTPVGDGASVVAEAWDAANVRLNIRGPGGKLRVGHRVPGAAYAVTLGTEKTVLTATDDHIVVSVPAGGVNLTIQPSP